MTPLSPALLRPAEAARAVLRPAAQRAEPGPELSHGVPLGAHRSTTSPGGEKGPAVGAARLRRPVEGTGLAASRESLAAG